MVVMIALALLGSMDAEARPSKPVRVVVTGAGAFGGQVLGSVAGMAIAGAIVDARLQRSCGGQSLCGEGAGLAVIGWGVPIGGSIGGSLGALGASSLIHGDAKGVGLTTGALAAVTFGSMMGGAVALDGSERSVGGEVLFVGGMAAGTLGPIPAAVLAEAIGPREERRVELVVSPVVGRHYNGLTVAATF